LAAEPAGSGPVATLAETEAEADGVGVGATEVVGVGAGGAVLALGVDEGVGAGAADIEATELLEAPPPDDGVAPPPCWP
jgi:hypothetical protein